MICALFEKYLNSINFEFDRQNMSAHLRNLNTYTKTRPSQKHIHITSSTNLRNNGYNQIVTIYGQKIINVFD